MEKAGIRRRDPLKGGSHPVHVLRNGAAYTHLALKESISLRLYKIVPLIKILMSSLALLSSDHLLIHAISEQLQLLEGWSVVSWPSLSAALEAWADEAPPLLLWDKEDTPANAQEVDRFHDKIKKTVPAPLLLILEGSSPTPDVLRPAEIFTRPLRLGAFLTRLQFYDRLLQSLPQESVVLGPWLFAPHERLLTSRADGHTETLTDKEAALLSCLSRSEEPISRETLLSEVWGYDARLETHTLETHIYRLRRKLAKGSPKDADVFLARQGGYQLSPAWRAP